MKGLIVAIAAAVIIVGALAAFAPASLLDARIASATDGRLRVAETSGSLWRGSGLLGAADGRWRIPVAWTLDVDDFTGLPHLREVRSGTVRRTIGCLEQLCPRGFPARSPEKSRSAWFAAPLERQPGRSRSIRSRQKLQSR